MSKDFIPMTVHRSRLLDNTKLQQSAKEPTSNVRIQSAVNTNPNIKYTPVSTSGKKNIIETKPENIESKINPSNKTVPSNASEVSFVKSKLDANSSIREYKSTGEMIVNGGMESFKEGIPTGWITTVPNAVSEVTAQGRVHSGESAVNLKGGADLIQDIDEITAGFYYTFSFFAHGKSTQAGLKASVIFTTPNGDIIGSVIMIRQQDLVYNIRNFAFYRTITSAAPDNVMGAKIKFEALASGEQSLDLDDVSFTTE